MLLREYQSKPHNHQFTPPVPLPTSQTLQLSDYVVYSMIVMLMSMNKLTAFLIDLGLVRLRTSVLARWLSLVSS